MPLPLRVISLLLFAWLFSAVVAVAWQPFSHPEIESDALRYEQQLRQSADLDGKTLDAWKSEAASADAAANPRAAVSAYRLIVASEPKNGDAWLALAKAILKVQPNDDNERWTLQYDGSAVAYTAYQRANAAAAKADALAVLATVLKTRSYWRPALNAFKSSLELDNKPEVRAAYELLLAEQGFRVLDYTVDADAAAPRLCVQFSEQLTAGKFDYSKFVSINGTDPKAIVVEGSQLCVEGLAHGERYAVQLRSGLPSGIDESLLNTADLSVYVRDRAPQARFTGRNYVLPNKGQQGIPLVSVNTEKVNVEVFRIGDRGLARAVVAGDVQNQLSGDALETLRNQTGVSIWKGELPVKLTQNQEVTTAFPVSDVIAELSPGVYVMIAEPNGGKSDYWSARATQWFVVSDLGLTALSGQDGVNVFVRSLESAQPVAGSKVKLVARNNDVLGEAVSDGNGYARFAGGLARGKGGAEPAVLVAETPTGDYAFLDLTSSAFDLTDRGVSGRAAPAGLDAFVVTERGVYRPGESVYFTALLRDDRQLAVTGIPLTLVISRPDGVEQRRDVLADMGLGGRSFTFASSKSAMTGTWRARIFADPQGQALAETSFLVEDFLPERIDLQLATDATALPIGTPGLVKVTGRYLYGPPAAGLPIEGDVIVSAGGSGLADYPSYSFGLVDEQIASVRQPLSALPSTDASGVAEVPVVLPALPQSSKPLQASVVLRLREPSGRVVERSLSLPIAANRPMIGIKSLFGGEIGNGEVAEFNVIQLGADGKPIPAKGLKWEIQRVDYSYQWYSRNGSWNYEPIKYTSRVAGGVLDGSGSDPQKVAQAVDWGTYRLEVSGDGANAPVTSVEFYSGWYGGNRSADTPEVLQVALDKETYKSGETAKLRITPQGAGRAVIAVLRDGLLSSQEIDVPAAGTTIDLKVDAGWLPGAYVTAMMYRPMDIAAKRMPARSIGVAWLPVDAKERTVGIDMTVPEKVGSGDLLSVPLKVTGLVAGEDARVVVAAVDVGILNVTGYEAPKPEGWYFAQRQIGVDIRDLYGRLIDGMRAERGTARSGGDGGGAGASLGSVDNVDSPLALYSGLQTVAADGTVTVDFTLPEFNGTVKLMAMAWTRDKLGHAEKDVTVRDAVAVTVANPRFMTFGDQAQILFDLHNVEGQDGVYKLAVDRISESGQTLRLGAEDVSLKKGERSLKAVKIAASDIGLSRIEASITGPGDIAIARKFELAINSPAKDIVRNTVRTVAANGGKITIDANVLADFIEGRAQVSLSMGVTAGLDVPGLLTALDRYPYGCAEQTTSRALPLLYLNTVAAAVGLHQDAEIKGRVDGAIARLLEMQDSSGGFGLWGPGSNDLWLSAYVTDFLTRAREQGYQVPPIAFGLALDKLQNSVAYASDFESGGEDIAYALYVLARNARAPVGDLRYYADTRLDRFGSALAKAQIGAALAMYGDKVRAEAAFDAAVISIRGYVTDSYRPDYGSGLRDSAATLTLVAETATKRSATAELATLINKGRLGRTYTSTQEQAWMLLAARALFDDAKSLKFKVNGEIVDGQFSRRLNSADLAKGPLVIENLSDVPVQAVVTVTGESATAEPAADRGYTIGRSYFRLDGTPVDIADGNWSVKQNDRFVVVLKVQSGDGAAGRLMLVDQLPAGLEIENPRLVEGGSANQLSWLAQTVVPEHAEFRDDRFVATFTRDQASNEIVVAYIVRAVTPGSYVHPAATAEDMYRPDLYGRTRAGKLTVDPAG